MLPQLRLDYNIRGTNSHSPLYKFRDNHSMAPLKMQWWVKITHQCKVAYNYWFTYIIRFIRLLTFAMLNDWKIIHWGQTKIIFLFSSLKICFRCTLNIKNLRIYSLTNIILIKSNLSPIPQLIQLISKWLCQIKNITNWGTSVPIRALLWHRVSYIFRFI